MFFKSQSRADAIRRWKKLSIWVAAFREASIPYPNTCGSWGYWCLERTRCSAGVLARTLGGPLDEIGQDANSVTDVGIDGEEIGRRAALPLPRVKRHHLHQTARADGALRPRVQLGILRQEPLPRGGRG